MLVYLNADSILMGRAKFTGVSDAEFDGCRVIFGRMDRPNILDDEFSGFTKSKFLHEAFILRERQITIVAAS